jgi:hypothetical protein
MKIPEKLKIGDWVRIKDRNTKPTPGGGLWEKWETPGRVILIPGIKPYEVFVYFPNLDCFNSAFPGNPEHINGFTFDNLIKIPIKEAEKLETDYLLEKL